MNEKKVRKEIRKSLREKGLASKQNERDFEQAYLDDYSLALSEGLSEEKAEEKAMSSFKDALSMQEGKKQNPFLFLLCYSAFMSIVTSLCFVWGGYSSLWLSDLRDTCALELIACALSFVFLASPTGGGIGGTGPRLV